MMSREFVDSVVSGNNIEAEAAFKSSISTKVPNKVLHLRKLLLSTIKHS